MIKAMLEQIDIILQTRKSLQVREEKLGQVFPMITKMSKDPEAEENIVEQERSNIENLKKKMTKAQNPSTHFPNTSNKTVAVAARSATATV